MAKYSNYFTSNWDEDGYPEREDELEYIEEYEEENDTYDYGYSPVQGNWDPRDFEEDEDGGFQRIGRKTRSVKSYEEQYEQERKAVKRKRRKEAKAKEKARQKYYHYNEE